MANKKIYAVSYLGYDKVGQIVKSVDIVASSVTNAIKQVKDISNALEVYGAYTTPQLTIKPQ